MTRRWQLWLVLLAVLVLTVPPLMAMYAVPWARWQLRDHDSAAACLADGVPKSIGSRQRRSCLTQAFTATIKKRGISSGLNAIDDAAAASDRVHSECHVAMHTVGQIQAARVAPSQLPTSVDWQAVCSGGFLHGYMQQLAGTGSSAARLLELVGPTCRTSTMLQAISCVHAVGHGVARASSNDLPRAAAACLRIEDDLDRECVVGAVMELELAQSSSGERSLDATMGPDRDIDCHLLPARAVGSCLSRELHQVVGTEMDTKGVDPVQVMSAVALRMCAPESGVTRATCFTSLGARVGVDTELDQVAVAGRVCGSLTIVDANACFYGLGWLWAGSRSAPASVLWKRCRQLPPGGRSACIAGVGHGAALARDTVSARTACDGLRGDELPACANGVRRSTIGLGLI